MKETDLAAMVKHYFTGPSTDVFCEVACSGIIDIVARTGNVITAIECKMTFSLDVIEQAVKNKTYAHYSYVAIPKGKRYVNHFTLRICKEFGIGVLIVPLDCDWVDIKHEVAPRLNRRIIKPDLYDFQKNNTPGVQFERATSFSHFVETLKRQLSYKPGQNHRELFENCFRHYNTATYLKNNVLTYIRTGVIKGVEYRDKKFYLTSATH